MRLTLANDDRRYSDAVRAKRKLQAEWVERLKCYFCGEGYNGEHRMEEGPSGWYHIACHLKSMEGDIRRGAKQ